MAKDRSNLAEDRVGKRARIRAKERAILVGLELIGGDQNGNLWDIEESMKELDSLARTAGVKVLQSLWQKRSKPDPSFLIGKGKADEIREMAEDLNAHAIIFNEELSPAQSRNLEEKIGRKVVDRPQLIMDIFAQRAQTKEAKLQVELAQYEYLLPRLRGWGQSLERLGGGIGTRGPGETRLERDRQKVQRRIDSIRKKLKRAAKEMEIRRKRRAKNGIPEVALIGYTNAGKTTLLNSLTDAEGFIEDKLFATLDPLTRKLRLPDKREIVLTDTVGLIRKLPHQLIPAFRSTLHSARSADLLINVMDASQDKLAERWRAVNQILNEDVFGEEERPPMINALNKVDDLENGAELRGLKKEIDKSIPISAAEGTNLEGLKELIAAQLGDEMKEVSLEIPYAQAELLDLFHENGLVQKEEYHKEGISLEGTIERHLLEEILRKVNGKGNGIQEEYIDEREATPE